MELKEILKDYDEFEGAYVTSYTLKLDNETIYNIEKHESDYCGRIAIFETSKNKYHNISIYDKLQKELEGQFEESSEGLDEDSVVNAQDICYNYEFTTYNSQGQLEELFNNAIKALEKISKGVI